MDMRYEAAPMEATAEMTVASVKAQKVLHLQVIERDALVASFSCPSIAGSSISAVAPDYDFIGGTALAAA